VGRTDLANVTRFAAKYRLGTSARMRRAEPEMVSMVISKKSLKTASHTPKKTRSASILDALRGEERRSICRTDDVARQIAGSPKLFTEAVDAMASADPVVRMRAADAIEKATRQNPELLQPYKRQLLRKIALVDQQEVRWHIAQMIPRLKLT